MSHLIDHPLDDAAINFTGMLDPRSREYQEVVRLTPATLAQYRTRGQWQPAKHLLYAAAEIAAEVSQGDARIIVEMPPRHGKSELDSVHTPIWFLDRWPHLNVMLATFASELSEGFGRRVRDAFIEDDGQFLRAQIRDDVQRTDFFMTTAGGCMMATGIGGVMTGRGAHLLIIDDYVKNFEAAMSEAINEKTWMWFLSTAYTRLEPGASIIVLATRWPAPKGDLIGRILQKEGHRWKRIRFPALAEPGDLLGRQPGEALWPERGYHRDRLLRTKSLIDGWLFDALYQQNPRGAETVTANVDMIRIVDKIPDFVRCRWVRSWDLAASEKKRSDYTVGTLLGTEGRPGSPFAVTTVCDVKRERLSPEKVELLMQETAKADGVEVEIVIEQEPGASGVAYADHIVKNVLPQFNVTVVPTAGAHKIVRANPYMAAVNHGRIAYVRAVWNDICKDELKDFSGGGGEHDDTVDSAAMGYNHLFTIPQLSAVWGRSGDQRVLTIQQPKTRKLVKGCVFGRMH